MKAIRKSDISTIDDVIRLVATGDIRQLEAVLFNQPELIDAKEDSNFNTPLQVACSRGHLPIAHFLVAKSASCNSQDMFGNTPLHYACDKSRKNIVEFLLENGSNPNIPDHRGSTPIHNACAVNDLSVVHTLLRHGAVADHLDHSNLRPSDKTSSSSVKLAIENFLVYLIKLFF